MKCYATACNADTSHSPPSVNPVYMITYMLINIMSQFWVFCLYLLLDYYKIVDILLRNNVSS